MNYSYEIGNRTIIKNNIKESNPYWISETPNNTNSELKKQFFQLNKLKVINQNFIILNTRNHI